MKNKDFGNYGEDIACNYLHKIGYKIIDRNYRAMGTEIDIICLDKNILVFVEVKSRSSKKFGEALEAIDSKKINNIVKTAINYIMKYDYSNLQVRFDVIEYYKSGDLNHIKNAFEVA